MSVLDSAQQLWKIWELRGFLLFSFSLQCILVLTASMRKRTSNMVWIGLIWLTYLLADWSAYYAIGLIPPPTTRTSGSEHDKYYGDLQAFWAPFLLLHIGGPTTIAAFSLEDNETWRRSAFHLLGQAGLTLFIMIRALTPHYSNPLLAPTLLMFVAAFTRYLERVLALYYASMNKFLDLTFEDPDFGNNFELLLSHSNMILNRHRPGEVQMVKDSYILFQSFKRIFGDMPIYSKHKSHDLSKHYLLEVLSPLEAFKAMEIQMNLAYDTFYTKTWVIMETKVGQALHAISLCSEMVALVLWGLASWKTRYYSPVDVRVTNVLVLGGAVVNVVSCLKLLFSDTMIAKLAKMKWVKDSNMLNKALLLRDHGFWSGWLMINRWSGTTPRPMLLMDFPRVCVNSPYSVWPFFLLVSSVWSFLNTYVGHLTRSVKVSEQVKGRVIEQIKDRVDAISRDGVSLQLSDLGCFMRKEHAWEELDVILENVLLVEALKLFYYATAGFMTDVSRQVYVYLDCCSVDQASNLIADQREFRRISFERRFSEYTGKKATPDQVQEALMNLQSKGSSAPMNRDHFWILIKHVKDHLEGLEQEVREAVVEDIWIGLLCITASRCKGKVHLEQLSKGGQLLTLVWLLLTNVGLIGTIQVPGKEKNQQHSSPVEFDP